MIMVSKKMRPVMAQGHKRMAGNVTVVGSIPSRKNELFNTLICTVLPLNMQCLQNSFLDIAWIFKKTYFEIKIN